MVAHPKFRPLSVHKKAGLEETLVFACESKVGSSMEPLPLFNVSRALDTTTVATVDLIDYKFLADYERGDSDSALIRSGHDAMVKYDSIAVPLAESHGMRKAMEFEVRQSLIQSDVSYNEIRIYTYPNEESLEAFQQDDNAYLPLVQHHYTAAVREASKLQASPMFVNALGGYGMIGFQDACQVAEPRELDEINPSVWCA